MYANPLIVFYGVHSDLPEKTPPTSIFDISIRSSHGKDAHAIVKVDEKAPEAAENSKVRMQLESVIRKQWLGSSILITFEVV